MIIIVVFSSVVEIVSSSLMDLTCQIVDVMVEGVVVAEVIVVRYVEVAVFVVGSGAVDCP